MSPISSSKSFIETHQVPGFGIGFTSTNAGNLAFHILNDEQDAQTVETNRYSLEDQLDIDRGSLVFLNQVHSATVIEATETDAWQNRNPRTADAVTSADGSQPLAIMVADCLPVVFTTNFGACAVAHAGRVGLLDGVLENTVDALQTQARESGVQDPQIQAFIGPSICGACYEVPQDMVDEVAPDHPEMAATTSWGTPSLDLAAGAQSILEKLLVTVHRSAHCTRENPELFSHRRQPGQGRIAGVVWRRDH